MKLRKYKPRRLKPNGQLTCRVPQCQHVDGGKQCERAVYSEARCFDHYTPQYTPSGKRVFLWI
jgi:hypothetical protein